MTITDKLAPKRAPQSIRDAVERMAAAERIELPDAPGQSRLHKPVKPEPLDDVATAGERIEAFWEKYPEGSILTEIDTRVVETPEHLPYSVYTARVFVRKNADAESPDVTAHATRSEDDPDPITAQFAQETAETSAVSRALRNIGILATPKKPTTEPAPTAERTSALAAARQKAGLSQKALADRMRDAGLSWTQATVSKIERGTRALADVEVKGLRTIGVEVVP
jgi:hypothetical protein